MNAYKVPQPKARKANWAPISGTSALLTIPLPKYAGSFLRAAAIVVLKPIRADTPETPARKTPAEILQE